MTKIYKMDSVLYSVLPEKSNWVHKLKRKVFTKDRAEGRFPTDFHSLLAPTAVAPYCPYTGLTHFHVDFTFQTRKLHFFPMCHRTHAKTPLLVIMNANECQAFASCSCCLFLRQWNSTERMHWGERCSPELVSGQGNELWLLPDMKQHFLWKGHLLGFR